MSVLERVIGWLAPPQCIRCSAEGAVLCGGCSAGAAQVDALVFAKRL